jgi:hypothetical protein
MHKPSDVGNQAAIRAAYDQMTPEERMTIDHMCFVVRAGVPNAGPQTALEIVSAIGKWLATRE